MTAIVHVAASWENKSTASTLMRLLERSGFELSDDWTKATQPEHDLGRRLPRFLSADVFVVLLPAGRSTHVEIGMALVLGKPVVIVALLSAIDPLVNPVDGRVCSYYTHPGVAIVRSAEEVPSMITKCLTTEVLS